MCVYVCVCMYTRTYTHTYTQASVRHVCIQDCQGQNNDETQHFRDRDVRTHIQSKPRRNVITLIRTSFKQTKKRFIECDMHGGYA